MLVHDSSTVSYRKNVWVFLQHSLLIQGKDVREKYPLKPALLHNVLALQIDEINSAAAVLENNSLFEMASIKLYTALKTFFFAEKYLLKKGEKRPISEFLEAKFSRLYPIVRTIYDDAVKRSVWHGR